MKTVLTLALAIAVVGCESSGDKTALQSAKDTLSYAIGLNIGDTMVRDSLEVDFAALLQGIKDARADTSKRLMNRDQMRTALIAWQQGMQTRRMEQQQAAAGRNREDGEKFLEENKKEPGIVTLPSGLQYKVLVEGKGPRPTKDQIVVTHYVGALVNGQEFDSSHRRGEPAEFRVGEVIAGWTEALQLMTVGSKWKLFIPSSLAYGEHGIEGVIPPGSALIFEIELISIK
jgi:FKBP-type peptidyl-prolyl cis-trans isomerase FklB